jgi:aspartyl/asparaginyl-tRNA synthetase
MGQIISAVCYYLNIDVGSISKMITESKREEIKNIYDSNLIIDTIEYDYVVQKLREFFRKKGFLEAHTQNRLSIMAACEDPWTVTSFNYDGQEWPLPQTGQMWLEYELLKRPEIPGFYCISTSYREEPHPVSGRHDLIFPLFEFEMHGGMEDLIKLEQELLESLGYDKSKFTRGNYDDVAKKYEVDELEHQHEQLLYDDDGPTYFLCNFPESTSPFWNMKRDTKTTLANKVDVILSGQETIGSAERETNTYIMKQRFKSISDGEYRERLYDLYGKERTDAELHEYFNFNFFQRSGGGIGVTRLIRSMRKEGLLPETEKPVMVD